MLDSEIDSLLDVPVLNLLVDNNTDCALCNVVDDSSLAVVDLVWHTVQSQYEWPVLQFLPSDDRIGSSNDVIGN